MSKVNEIFKNLGYTVCNENDENAITFSLQYIENQDGSIRWIWPDRNTQPLFLNFYNILKWKALLFSFVVRMIFFLKLNYWFFKKIKLTISKDVTNSKFDISNTNWALFTGTIGPNQKYIVYHNDHNTNGVFIKIPISELSETLINHEKQTLLQLSNYQISNFAFPKIIENNQPSLILSYPEKYNQRSQTITDQHIKIFEALEAKSVEVHSFEDFSRDHQLMSRLNVLRNNRNSIPSGILKKLQKLHTSLVGSSVTTHFAHMDFTPWNMYADNQGKLYIYDWELSSTHSPKGFDFFHFIIQKGILSERKNWIQIKEEIEKYSSVSYFKHENTKQMLSLYLLMNCLYYLEIYNVQEKWHVQINWLLEVWNDAISDMLSLQEKTRELIILDIFDWLKGKPYAGLKLPESPIERLSVYSDIDLIIDRKQAILLFEYLKNHPLVLQVKTHQILSKTLAMIITKKNDLLSIDCIHQLKRKNIDYMSVDEMIADRIVDAEGIQRVNEIHTAEFITQFYGLNDAKIPEKYQSVSFDQLLSKCKLNEALQKSDENGLSLQKKLMLSLKNEQRNQGFSYLKNTITYYIDTVCNMFSQRGMIITFSGVDGAGKSTIIALTKIEIEKKLRRNVVVIRHRPSLLPILSAWTKGKARAENDAAITLPRQGQNRGVISSLFRFSYYYLDYLVGQFYIYLRHVCIGNIVLYDRYYFDFINDSLRSNIILPKWFLRNGYRFLLQPNLNYFLYADPKTILSRKKELDESSIKTLTRDYLQLFSELGKKHKNQYLAIENIVLDETLATISKQIQTKLF